MERADLIITGISPWGAHTRFPFKKSGEYRVTMNYQPVNSATLKPQWPVHSRDGLFYTLIQGNHRVFFQGDAAHGYWAVKTKYKDLPKTAFIAPNGQWLNLRMPQGMTGSPRNYCKVIESHGSGPMLRFRWGRIIALPTRLTSSDNRWSMWSHRGYPDHPASCR